MLLLHQYKFDIELILCLSCVTDKEAAVGEECIDADILSVQVIFTTWTDPNRML